MSQKPKVRWHPRNGCWTSCVGPISEKTGRRKPVYWRGIPKNQPGKARAALEEYLAERDSEIISGADYTFDDLRTLYLSHSKVTAKPLTYLGHRKVLRLVRAFTHKGKPYAEKLARDFTATDLERIVQAWHKRGLAATYIARMVASVQAVFNWAAAPVPNRDPERLIETNPLKGYSSIHCKMADAPDRFIDDGPFEKFMRWAWARARGKGSLESRFDRSTVWLIRVAALTGTRPNELCVAEWGDFNQQAAKDQEGQWWGSITLDPNRWKSGGKTKKERVIYLPPRAVKIVETIGRHPDRHPRFIWAHRRGPGAESRGAGERVHGEPWNTNALSRKIREWRKEAIEAGIPLVGSGEKRLTMYLLRHNAARKILAKTGGDTYLTGKLIGSSAAMVQKVYGSSDEDRMIDAAAGLVGRAKRPTTS